MVDSINHINLDKKYVISETADFGVVIESGKNATLKSVDGKKYIDMVAGLGAAALGHANKSLIKAVSKQLGRLAVNPCGFYSVLRGESAARLCQLTNMSCARFTAGGTEANDYAVKAVVGYFMNQSVQKYKVVVPTDMNTSKTRKSGNRIRKCEMDNSVAGRFVYVQYNDTAALARACADPAVACVLVQPVQHYNKFSSASEEFLWACRTETSRNGSMLIIDETECGGGRTGRLLSHTVIDNLEPDAITLSKGLAGGFPFGAALLKDYLHEDSSAALHTNPYTASPIALAICNKTLDTVLSDKFMKSISAKGRVLSEVLAKIADNSSVESVNNTGLMGAVTLSERTDVNAVIKRLIDSGVLTCKCGDNSLRITPPLTIEEKDLRAAIAALEIALK